MAFKRMAVEWVKEQSEHFNSTRTSKDVWVHSIQILAGMPSPQADIANMQPEA
jgi:hypothetical protein